MGLFGDSNENDPEDYDWLIADDAGPTATPKRAMAVAEPLGAQERIHHAMDVQYVKRGAEADDESKSNSALGKSGTVVFTESRVVILIPRRLSKDEFFVQYEQIVGVSFDTRGVVGAKHFTITTPGDKYRLLTKPSVDNDEVRKIVGWVDEKIGEPAAPPPGGQQGKSTSERLSELEELREEDLISDAEYNDKRTDILEEL